MGNPPPLRVDTPSLHWEPAEVTVPPLPAIPAGGDPMSVLISAIMPDLAAPLTEAVAATAAREHQFAANLAAARNAYQSADQAGEQEITAVADTRLLSANTQDPFANPAAPSPGEHSGQFVSSAMQAAGQAAQAPLQLTGMAAAGTSGIVQGVVQQLSQLSGSFGRTEDDDSYRSDQSRGASQVHEDEQGPPLTEDGAGGSSAAQAPVGEPPAGPTPDVIPLGNQP